METVAADAWARWAGRDAADTPKSVDDHLREAVAILEVLSPGSSSTPPCGDESCQDCRDVGLLRELLDKDPHLVLPKEDYHILREIISARRACRVAAEVAVGRRHALLLALVLAAKLPLDGVLLAAQALFHALPEDCVLPLLRRPRHWEDAAELVLYHGLLSSGAVLVQQGAETSPLARSVVGAVAGPCLRVVLRECRRTSHLTKTAFKMLHVSLTMMIKWQCRPSHATLDEVYVLISASWEVPLPGLRECNEDALVQLQELALHGATWPEVASPVAEGEPEVEGEPEAKVQPAQEAYWLGLRDNHGLFDRTVRRVSWRSKHKYLVLKVLARRYSGGGARALRDHPALLDGMLLGMAGTYLASAATGLYRTVLGSMTLADWERLCLPTITARLVGTDRKLVMNLLHYWVGPTIKALPEALSALLIALKAAVLDMFGLFDFNVNPARQTYAHAAYLYLIKTSRKIGAWEPSDGSEEVDGFWSALQWGAGHSDPWVRGVALSAMCVSARQGQPLSGRELAAALRFLEVNVLADDSRLRHTMLDALAWLLMRVRFSLPVLVADHEQADDEEQDGAASRAGRADLVTVARFLGDLHRFLLSGLLPGSNYQRRITCLSVYQLMVCYLGPAASAASLSTATSTAGGRPFKNSRQGQRESLPQSDVLQRHLQLDSDVSRRLLLRCVLDPTDDVRSKAADILSALLDDSSQLPGWPDIIALCNSQRFFTAEGGALLGSVLSSWEARRGLSSVEPSFLLDECSRQLTALQSNVLRAATSGPLHGVLGLVRRLLPPGGRQPGAWVGTEGQLLELLEQDVDTCLNLLASKSGPCPANDSSDSHYAPSFAEMGEAIDSLVEDGSEALLTAEHQLVLNCIWLNLKASCALASDLVGWQGLDALQVERLARLPIAVLIRCRHKGAIESAGTALQQVVKTLTEQPDVRRRELPLKLLLEFLQRLLEGSTAKGTSVSRRSAGMAILIHRIVLGDQQPDKPLLHKCISCLFALLESADPQQDVEAQHDLPQTQALHFLRTLVADASLRVSMSPHLCQAALYCFRHLSSSVWSIRNASLQLFGALVPKIVGQGKSLNATEDEEDTLVGCIEFEDLMIRFSPLCTLLLHILEATPSSDLEIKNHAELIPSLSLLASLSVSEASPWSTKEIGRFKSAFLQLLPSCISVVRFLSAKAFTRFTPLMQSFDACNELVESLCNQTTENGRVGVLTAMKLIKDYVQIDGQLTDAVYSEHRTISDFIKLKMSNRAWNITSFVSHALLLSFVEQSNDNSINLLHKFLDRISTIQDQTHIGVAKWIAKKTRHILTKCNSTVLPQVLDVCLTTSSSTDVPRTALLYFKKRVDEKVAHQVLQEIFEVCLKHLRQNELKSNYDTFHLLNLILKIIVIVHESKMTLEYNIGMIDIIFNNFLSSKFGTCCEAVALPVVAGLTMLSCERLSNARCESDAGRLSRKIQDDVLRNVRNLLYKFSSPDNNEHFRLAAARALRFAGSAYTLCKYRNSSTNDEVDDPTMFMTATFILHTAIQLLQDEDSEIREEAAHYVIDHDKGVYITSNYLECLHKLFTPGFLSSFLHNQYQVILFLWDMLSTNAESLSSSEKNHTDNPFCHGQRNIFSEEVWVVEQAGKVLEAVVRENHSGLDLHKIFPELWQSYSDIQSDIIMLTELNDADLLQNVLEEKQESNLYLLQRKTFHRIKVLSSFLLHKETISALEDQLVSILSTPHRYQ